MHVIHRIQELRQALSGATRTSFVPTMGYLHAGHLALIQAARRVGQPVVASIFVNRLQFGAGEDFATYPRHVEQDCALLRASGCDIAFVPAETELYPQPQVCLVRPPAALAGTLEGRFRPGHFVGVCTVVLKLFNIVQPRTAWFGRKDFQQLTVLRHMVRQLALPIDILSHPTVRAIDGLALSSRNSGLNDEQRREAVRLSQVLRQVAAAVSEGRHDWRTLERSAMQVLARHGWKPDYIAIRRRIDLGPPRPGTPLIVLGAAHLGSTRLVDNIEPAPCPDP